MNIKRMIEVGFLVLFGLGVGGALLVHQSYDQWLTELVQASGKKIGVGRLEVNGLRWLAADQKLNLVSAQWFDADNTRKPWLTLSSIQWQLPIDAWQGPLFRLEQLTLQGASIHIQQEGLSTNINRLIKQVEAVAIPPEKLAKGQEPLLFKVNSCSLVNLHITLSTLKHGELSWDISELVLPVSSSETGSSFDVLLQQLTLRLLAELRIQATQHLLLLAEAKTSSAAISPAPVEPEIK